MYKQLRKLWKKFKYKRTSKISRFYSKRLDIMPEEFKPNIKERSFDGQDIWLYIDRDF